MDSACESFGNQVVVWSGINPTTNHIVIYSAFRPANGLWETPVQISSNPTSETVETPRVCISDDGKITAVWFRDDGTNVGVRAAERATSSSWGASIPISGTVASGSLSSLTFDCVSDNPVATAAAAWVDTSGATPLLDTSILVGALWTNTSVFNATTLSDPISQMTPNGTIYIATISNNGGTTDVEIHRSTDAGGSWNQSLVNYPVAPTEHDFAVNNNGAGVSGAAMTGSAELHASSTSNIASWPATPDPVVTTIATKAPGAGIDATGRSTIIWQTDTPGNIQVASNTNLTTPSFSTPTTISSGTSNTLPPIDVNENGGMVASWKDGSTSQTNLKVGSNGVFETNPTLRVEQSQEAVVCISNSGIATAAWLDTATPNNNVQANRTIQALSLLQALGNKRLIFQRGLMQ